jgi:hypothetical protein
MNTGAWDSLETDKADFTLHFYADDAVLSSQNRAPWPEEEATSMSISHLGTSNTTQILSSSFNRWLRWR